jgi:hypothetical protein
MLAPESSIGVSLQGVTSHPFVAGTGVMLWDFLREQMRGSHDLLKQKPTSLYLLLGWSSISMVSLTMLSIYRVLVGRMEVS